MQVGGMAWMICFLMLAATEVKVAYCLLVLVIWVAVAAAAWMGVAPG